ncbi:hypothetical protein [Nocardia niigatensis]|uniref:hypothetical protein n=1 Tax=Nocardia niigatensis TaxID=209249 RepID=UPI00059426ED|nr:hypothetical protein [Nocardia niigatensis]
MRLELPEDAYKDVPSCWWSRRRWVAVGLALYDELYRELRATLRAPSVKRSTFLAWLIAESQCANIIDGRGCRPSVRHLAKVMERSPRTVKRCRELGRLMDLRQVVFRGRHRTKTERLEGWEREDRYRGWTAVAALIESPAYSHLVDNQVIETLLQQDFVTPLPRSGGSLFLLRETVVSSTKNVRKRRAPRGTDKKGLRKKSTRAYDPEALLLASRIKADARFPSWARRMPTQGLAAVVTKRALAGWAVDDVYLALNDVTIAGKRIFDRPDNPYRYLAWLLGHTPVDAPPAALDRAREAEIEQAERQHRARQREEARAAAMAAAGPDSPGRREAMRYSRAIGAGAASRAADRARAAEYARRQLAQQTRDGSSAT